MIVAYGLTLEDSHTLILKTLALTPENLISSLILDKSRTVHLVSGDKELFESLESLLTSSLPQEPTEWRRSYGRIIKSVHVPATFVPFSKEILPKEGDYHLIHQPIFHTYWTQCPVSFRTM